MSESCDPTSLSPGDGGLLPGGTPAVYTTEPCPLNKFKLIDLTLTVGALNNKFIMNIPDAKFDVLATVTYAQSADPNDLDALPTEMKFSFTDPASDNTKKSDSFEYATEKWWGFGFIPGKFLGKKDDVSAVYWEVHPDNAAMIDASKQTAKVTTTNLQAAKKLTAKVSFKPSGVGGDDYKIKAAILSADGTVELLTKESNEIVVWRKVSFEIYEMQGETHLSTNATTATISPVFDPAFVEYTAGPRNELAPTHSVKYIGLWKNEATPQQDWAAVQQKKPDETPTAKEISDAIAGTDPVERDAARAEIGIKAQRWVNRINAACKTDMDTWVTEAKIPSNALVGIRYYHPKYSVDGGDYQTREWNLGGGATPSWLRVKINTFSGNYSHIDPDVSWVSYGQSLQGFSHSNGIITAPKGELPALMKKVVCHETGHATRSFFKRENFGPSLDHSASDAGIMYYSSAFRVDVTTFSDREKKILRGIKP